MLIKPIKCGNYINAVQQVFCQHVENLAKMNQILEAFQLVQNFVIRGFPAVFA